MDVAYLKQHVGPVLAEGLTAVSVASPEDEVEYLSRWLLKYADNQESRARAAAAARRDARKDREVERELAAEAEARAAREAAEAAAAARLEALLDGVSAAASPEDAVRLTLEAVRELGGASAGYAARFDAEKDELVYVAASAPAGAAAPVGEALARDASVTLDLLFEKRDEDAEEEEEEEEEDEDEMDDEAKAAKAARAAEKARKAAEIKQAYVPNVLVGPLAPKVRFHGLPDVGAYAAARVRYAATLHIEGAQAGVELFNAPPEEEPEEEEPEEEEDEDDEELDDEAKAAKAAKKAEAEAAKAAAKVEPTEEEKAAALDAKLTAAAATKEAAFALCFDTVGTASPIDQGVVRLFSRRLQDTLAALDRAAYAGEVRRLAALAAARPADKDDEAAEAAKKAVQEAAGGEEAPEDRVELETRRAALLDAAAALPLLAGRVNSPSADAVVGALLAVTGAEGVASAADAVKAYSVADLERPGDSAAAVARLTEGVDDDAVAEESWILAPILGFVRAAVASEAVERDERKRKAEEEAAAKAAAEAEAAAKAAAEAEAAAAAAAAAEAAEAEKPAGDEAAEAEAEKPAEEEEEAEAEAAE